MYRYRITKALLSAIVDEAQKMECLPAGVVASAAYVGTNLAWSGNYITGGLDDEAPAKCFAGEARRILQDVHNLIQN